MGQVLQRRRAKARDPAVVEIVLKQSENWIVETLSDSRWEAVLDAEPKPWMSVANSKLDEVLRAFLPIHPDIGRDTIC